MGLSRNDLSETIWLRIKEKENEKKLLKEGNDKEGTIKFRIGMKFLSMGEFRFTVR